MSGSGISWAICKSAPRSRQITTPAPHHSVFYRPGVFPAAQPTASTRHQETVPCPQDAECCVAVAAAWRIVPQAAARYTDDAGVDARPARTLPAYSTGCINAEIQNNVHYYADVDHVNIKYIWTSNSLHFILLTNLRLNGRFPGELRNFAGSLSQWKPTTMAINQYS